MTKQFVRLKFKTFMLGVYEKFENVLRSKNLKKTLIYHF